MIFSPKSPCGRTRRNASASTYANQFSIAPPTSGPQYTSPTFSPTPMISPPTTAPGTEVKPPRIRTGSALSATSDRLNCTPLLAPHMIPATIATIPATDQTISQIVLSGMPIESAASWSSATARSARPTRVRWKKTPRTATRTAAVSAANISSWLIWTPVTMNERSGMPMSSFLTLAPQTISPKPSRKKVSPIVAMNRMMCSWLTSGRSTTRSMTQASATITAVVPKRSSVMAHPEVGVEDGRVLADLGGRAVGDLAPVVEDHDAVRDVHDHAHVVLDERDRRAELRVDVEDEAAHVFLLLDVHAGHRLVEQEELGLGGERAPELHALLQPVGQSAGRGLADRLDLQKIDDPLDERAVLDLLTAGRAPVERLQQEASPRFEEPPRHEVVEHAHALEQGHVLEGSGDAEDGDVGRAEVRPVLAVEDDSSRVG